MSRKTEDLKKNLLHFINYTLIERCDNPVEDMVDECIENGKANFSSICRTIVNEETKEKEDYLLKISLKKV